MGRLRLQGFWPESRPWVTVTNVKTCQGEKGARIFSPLTFGLVNRTNVTERILRTRNTRENNSERCALSIYSTLEALPFALPLQV